MTYYAANMLFLRVKLLEIDTCWGLLPLFSAHVFFCQLKKNIFFNQLYFKHALFMFWKEYIIMFPFHPLTFTFHFAPLLFVTLLFFLN